MGRKNFVEELQWRGMIHTIMPGAEEQLAKEMTTAYLGIDPTADSLHIGHLVGVMILKHLQMDYIYNFKVLMNFFLYLWQVMVCVVF